jgi:hypothetical protein
MVCPMQQHSAAQCCRWVSQGTVVVHVLDISAPNAAAQCSTVLQVRGWGGSCCGEGGRGRSGEAGRG